MRRSGPPVGHFSPETNKTPWCWIECQIGLLAGLGCCAGTDWHLSRFLTFLQGGFWMKDPAPEPAPEPTLNSCVGPFLTSTCLPYVRTTRRDVRGEAMNILVTGGSGLIGSAMMPLLTAAGHRIVSLRRTSSGTG